MNKTKKLNILMSLLTFGGFVIGLTYATSEIKHYETPIFTVCFLVLVGFLLGLLAVFLEEKHFFKGENTSKTLWHVKIGLFFLMPLYAVLKGEVKIFVLLVVSAYLGTLALFYLKRNFYTNSTKT